MIGTQRQKRPQDRRDMAHQGREAERAGAKGTQAGVSKFQGDRVYGRRVPVRRAEPRGYGQRPDLL